MIRVVESQSLRFIGYEDWTHLISSSELSVGDDLYLHEEKKPDMEKTKEKKPTKIQVTIVWCCVILDVLQV